MSTGKDDGYTIRYATEEGMAFHVPTILQLINELASYEHALHEVLATESTLRSTLSFPSNPTKGYAKTLLITPNGSSRAAGMALYFHNYSTWHAAPGIYLEDLFVRPESRGKGYGHALLRELARECVRLGCRRLEWSVLKWNKPSIKFYESEKVGAKMMSEWAGMRVDGEGLEMLAGDADAGAGAVAGAVTGTSPEEGK